jgi:hypothetical protein
MFFDQGKLEYQVEYPLTGESKREGVLNKDTMKDAIDVWIERGHIVKIVPEGDEAAPPPHECYHVQQDQEQDFFIGAFTWLTTLEEWILGIIPRRKCCLRSRQSANLVRLQKTS